MNTETRTLFSLFQKIDYRDKENSGKKKLIGILTAYLFSNTILSYSFYISFDERSFVILALTSNLFLLALIILTDFENLFLAARYNDVLTALPVRSENVFKAKFLSAVIFLLFFILTASIPQAVFFYLIEYNVLKTIIFIITDLTFCYFAAGLLILIYIFALNYFKSKAPLILNILQILFFVFIFYSTSISSEISSRTRGFNIKENILNYGIVRYLPQTLFSRSVYSVSYFIICILLAALVFYLVYVSISGDYFSLLEKIRSLNRKKRFSKPEMNFAFLNNFINKIYLTNNYEIASYDLLKSHLRNSRFLRVKYIPVILMPVLFVLIGILSNEPHLLFFNRAGSFDSLFKDTILVISPTITFTLLMCSRLLISNTKILDDNTVDTQWIYDSLPITEKRFVIKGVNKFIYLNFIFPVLILIMILLSFKSDPGTVFINILFIASGIYFISTLSVIFDKVYPFTLESSKFNSTSKFIEIFLSMLMGLILFLIQIFVFQNIIFVIITIALFLTISFLLNRN